MAGEWEETTLGDCADWLSGGTPFKGNKEFWSGPIPWVSAKDMKSFRLHDAEDHISSLAVGSGGKIVPAGSILLLVRGMTLHNDIPICVVMREMAFNQDIKALRPAKDVDSQFLAYWLLAHKPDLLASVDHAGHGTGRLVTDVLKSKTLLLPSLTEQKAIARILGTLDDKIELNRRMSETLEAMARVLFKSWFVDFDPVRAKMEGCWQRGQSLPGLPADLYDLFPDRLVGSELGEIPEGWEVKTIGDLADLDKGLSYKGDGLSDEGGLPMINLGCFLGAGRFRPENIKRYRGEYRDRHLVDAGDLVIANTDVTQNRIILGSPALVPRLNEEGRYLFTHHTFAVRFKPGAKSWKQCVYFSLLRPEFREIAEGYATGTTVLALPRDGILRYSIVLPREEIRTLFDSYARNLIARMEAMRHEARILATLRDTLLPKLISGQLRVTDAMRAMETVV